jgi:hypothetical protein
MYEAVNCKFVGAFIQSQGRAGCCCLKPLCRTHVRHACRGEKHDFRAVCGRFEAHSVQQDQAAAIASSTFGRGARRRVHPGRQLHFAPRNRCETRTSA